GHFQAERVFAALPRQLLQMTTFYPQAFLRYSGVRSRPLYKNQLVYRGSSSTTNVGCLLTISAVQGVLSVPVSIARIGGQSQICNHPKHLWCLLLQVNTLLVFLIVSYFLILVGYRFNR